MHLMMSLSILSVLRAHTCVCLITCTCVECVLLLMWSRSVTQSAGFAIRQHVKIWPHCLQPSFHIQEPQRSTSICESGSLLRLHAWSVKMESKWTDLKFRGGHRLIYAELSFGIRAVEHSICSGSIIELWWLNQDKSARYWMEGG